MDLIKAQERHKARTYQQWMACIPQELKEQADKFMRTYHPKWYNAEAFDKAYMFGAAAQRGLIIEDDQFPSDIRINARNFGNSSNWVLEQSIGCEGAYIEGILSEIK